MTFLVALVEDLRCDIADLEYEIEQYRVGMARTRSKRRATLCRGAAGPRASCSRCCPSQYTIASSNARSLAALRIDARGLIATIRPRAVVARPRHTIPDPRRALARASLLAF